jgi:hypothetical protein
VSRCSLVVIQQKLPSVDLSDKPRGLLKAYVRFNVSSSFCSMLVGNASSEAHPRCAHNAVCASSRTVCCYCPVSAIMTTCRQTSVKISTFKICLECVELSCSYVTTDRQTDRQTETVLLNHVAMLLHCFLTKVYRTIIFPSIFCGSETRSLTLREPHHSPGIYSASNRIE